MVMSDDYLMMNAFVYTNIDLHCSSAYI